MCPDEVAYYRERALIERRRASDATSTFAANVHLDLADRYERLVELLELVAPTFRIVEIGLPAEFDSAKLALFSERQFLA